MYATIGKSAGVPYKNYTRMLLLHGCFNMRAEAVGEGEGKKECCELSQVTRSSGMLHAFQTREQCPRAEQKGTERYHTGVKATIRAKGFLPPERRRTTIEFTGSGQT